MTRDRCELERARRDGEQLGPGVYELDGELHVDIEELVIATGGDPTDPACVRETTIATALAMREHGITHFEVGES